MRSKPRAIKHRAASSSRLRATVEIDRLSSLAMFWGRITSSKPLTSTGFGGRLLSHLSGSEEQV
jgi:hypothetical protein